MATSRTTAAFLRGRRVRPERRRRAFGVFDRVAPSPKEIVVLVTGEHGTEILAYADPSVADELRQTVLDFLGTI